MVSAATNPLPASMLSARLAQARGVHKQHRQPRMFAVSSIVSRVVPAIAKQWRDRDRAIDLSRLEFAHIKAAMLAVRAPP